MERIPEKGVGDVSVEDIIEAGGLSVSDAKAFYTHLRLILSQSAASPLQTWKRVSKDLLTPSHPHSLHQLMYYSIYYNWDTSKLGPPLAWFPTLEIARSSNLGRLIEAHGKKLLGPSYCNPIVDFQAFQQFSVDYPNVYWSLVLDELSLNFSKKPHCILDLNNTSLPSGMWLPGAILNIAECCLSPKVSIGKSDDSNAVVWQSEGEDDLPLKIMTLAELRANVSHVANALDAAGFQKGDRIAIYMPMHVHSVIIYLAMILAGYVVVSIADSFSPSEVATRLRVSNARGIFTQDCILRGGKELPLYSRVLEARAPFAIVLAADGKSLKMELRQGDIPWNLFLSYADQLERTEEYDSVRQPIDTYTNILFSSGTTGEPKAIPWTHLSAIRCAAESWAHGDIKRGDVFVWPTNLGWMMGPFLIYSCLLNGATLGLYNGSPLGRGFGKFVEDAGVTKLGTVPSIVKTWKKSNCMNGLEWSKIQAFSSTGEASSLDDDLWLSARAWYKPVFECCGGTELAASFVYGCLLQPQAFAAFSTPSMTTDFVILDDEGNPYPKDQPCLGEIALVPLIMGASNTLLNADHDAIYFKGMPMYKNMQLRRHGDVFERMIGGYYKAHGRIDDTMNLGGIKISAVEIERVCNSAHNRILETAAIGVPSPGGGPEQLIIFVILKNEPQLSLENLKLLLSKNIQEKLNPLFKVSMVVVVNDFPRTASNKMMRRLLRAQLMQNLSKRSKL